MVLIRKILLNILFITPFLLFLGKSPTLKTIKSTIFAAPK